MNQRKIDLQLHDTHILLLRTAFIDKLNKVNLVRPSMFKLIAFANWEADVKELKSAISAIDKLHLPVPKSA